MNKRAFIEIFGLISVIGSLLFVGVEISQNTQAVRGATHKAVSDQASELYLESETTVEHYNWRCIIAG